MQAHPPPPAWARALLPLAAGLAAGLVAWATRPAVALDDAAITFRYAERLATGRGLTYTDGSTVLGASSPLHLLALALGRWAGIAVPTVAVGLGVAGTAVAAALIAWIARSATGTLAAVVAVALFTLSPVRWYATGGLESATLVCLALGALAAFQARREVAAGVLLGLALLAKLDAATLGVALVAAAVAVDRRAPSRLVAAAGAVVVPWFAWATWRFGAPWPQSLAAKASGSADGPGYRWDPTWPLRPGRRALPAAAGGLLALRWDRGAPDAWRIRVAVALWALLAAAAASLAPLGAPYPWYLVPALTAVALLGGDGAERAWRRLRQGSTSGPRGRAVAALVIVLVALSGTWMARQALAEVADGRAVGPAEALALDLRTAGAHLEAEHPGARVRSCFGWVAYAAPSAVIVDPCGINAEPAERGADAPFEVVLDDGSVPSPRPGTCELARFHRAGRSVGSPAVVLLGPCEQAGP